MHFYLKVKKLGLFIKVTFVSSGYVVNLCTFPLKIAQKLNSKTNFRLFFSIFVYLFMPLK